MYEIRPESIKTFIEDNLVRLPRFQRKQTWDDLSNFKLCISVFKEYPIGVSILSVERQDNKTSKWLLDGRQRRNALIKMAEDPENIYLWAKKFIGFKENQQPQEVEEKFWEKINEYLELEEIEEKAENTQSINVQESEDVEPQEQEKEEETEDSEKSSSKLSGLDLLLDLILLVHNKTKKYSGFSKPFDFTKWITSLPYVDNINGKQHLNAKKIKSFIKEYKNFCRDNSIEHDLKDNFIEFLNLRFRLNSEIENKIKKEIERRWDKIIDRIELLDKIDNLLFQAKIGLIEVKNINTADGQKIFNIINTGGTQLTAVEILSAKPSWTKVIKNPNPELLSEAKKLYGLIQIKNEDVVRWDIPATLVSRLRGASFIFKDFSDSKTSDFEKKLTLGFKLLSGLYLGGVKKDDVNNLSLKENINWEIDFDRTISELNTYIQLVGEYEYFKYFKSWKSSIMDILSDAIALNFIIISFKDWKRKGSPIGGALSVRQFQKNSFILYDRLIYEYVTRQWRGSSDSKIAQNITSFSSQPEIFIPVEKDKWLKLLKEIFDQNTIDDTPINQKILEPILYHFYCMRKIAGPDTGLYSIEVDHIIPQALFRQSSTIENKDLIQHNIFNLALLPKNENISKSSSRLIEINDQWLKDQIKKYEFIDEADFQKFSNINNLNDLKTYRRTYFEEAFDSKRDNILN